MATSSEAVRRLSYKVDSDDAVRRIGNVTAAQKGVTAALNEGSAATDINEARTAKLQSRYDELVKQQRTYQSIAINQAAAVASSTLAMTAANDNYAQSHSHLSDVLRVGTKAAIDHAASWLATIGAVGAGLLVLGGVLGVLGPIILTYKLVKDAIGLATEAWQLSGEKLEEWRQIANNAAKVDLSPEFFQRLSKGAEGLGVEVDDLTKSLQALKGSSADTLGGSALDKKVGALEDAGNFNNNPGSDQLQQANTNEERYRAVAAIIHQAMQDGERLAAIDLANTAFGSDVADHLRTDSEYLDKILAAADKVSQTQLVSDADIGRALEMQQRWDAAVKILEQRWHPIQDLLTQGGIALRSTWVDIVFNIAQAVDYVVKLAEKIPTIQMPEWMKTGWKAGVTAAAGAVAGPVAGAAVGYATGVYGSSTAEAAKTSTDTYSTAVDRLRAGLQNQNTVQQAVNQTTTIANKVLGDTSHTIDTATKATNEQKDALDRAIDAIERNIATTTAHAQTIDQTVAEQARAKTMAELLAAAQRAGITDLSAYSAQFKDLSDRAGAATQALSLARVQSQIKFGSETALLSPGDVAIAQQLKGIYPDVATALGSVEASALRTNQALSGLSSSLSNDLTSGLTDITTGTKSVSQGFSDMAGSVVKSIEQMIIKIAIVEPLMRSLQATIGGAGLGGLFGIGSSSGAAAQAASASTLAGNTGGAFFGPGFHSGGIVGSEPSFMRMVNPSHFAGAARLHTGGIAGDEVPIIARKGEGVFTQGQMAALGAGAMGGGGVTSVVVNNNGTPMTVLETKDVPDGRGGRRIELTLDDQVAANLSRPGSASQRAMRSNYGARPVGVKR
ncbi:MULTISPECIES: hypothetical protein [unclassified Bradyrhizobium]|uniref:hypothetical protein n=1 Tax=unclassified Bradyrhizobium TaxID=2631580 RepID=UPI001FFA4462|nr:MULTISPECIES: hypothetical protein [unclassified Bradyrhizobium]MCK1536888.1 hypothetical protein [Bradyrhizobium sp. 176]MCK1560191.1 hypothetical protein [Bradyrhizobium sp. 171]